MTDGSSLLELAAEVDADLDQLRLCAEEAADINVCQPETGKIQRMQGKRVCSVSVTCTEPAE